MTEWIKCSDEMPPMGQPVLVYGIADNPGEPMRGSEYRPEPMIAVYERSKIGIRSYWHSVGDCGYEHEDSISEPLYWMPLPAPPDEPEPRLRPLPMTEEVSQRVGSWLEQAEKKDQK